MGTKDIKKSKVTYQSTKINRNKVEELQKVTIHSSLSPSNTNPIDLSSKTAVIQINNITTRKMTSFDHRTKAAAAAAVAF
jgi:hypothetical protein